MDLTSFLLTVGIGILLFVLLVFALLLWGLYAIVGKFTKSKDSQLWATVLIVCAAFIFIPDPLDVLTGGLPLLEIGLGGLSAYKLRKR